MCDEKKWFYTHGVDGFLPASQLAPAHAIKTVLGEEKSLLNQMKKYIGQVFNVKILSIPASFITALISLLILLSALFVKSR